MVRSREILVGVGIHGRVVGGVVLFPRRRMSGSLDRISSRFISIHIALHHVYIIITDDFCECECECVWFFVILLLVEKLKPVEEHAGNDDQI